jgi:methyl-accepting chemotaxis protein
MSKTAILARIKSDQALIASMHQIGKVIEGREREIATAFWESWGQHPKVRELWGYDGFVAAIDRSTAFLKQKYKNAETLNWLDSIEERGRYACREGIDFLSFAEASHTALERTQSILGDTLDADPQQQTTLLQLLSKANAYELAMMSDAYTSQQQDDYLHNKSALANSYRDEIVTSINESNHKSQILKDDGNTARDIAQKTLSKTAEIATAAEQSAMAMRDAASTAGGLITLIDSTRSEVTQTQILSDKAWENSQKAIDASHSLNEEAQSIGQILQLIRAVASQTNMLALNATIEAARAGEAGRGFSVVAQEVKALAKTAADAANEIGQKMQAIGKAITMSANASDEIVASVQEVKNSAARIQASLDQQASGVTTITASVDETALTAELMASTVSTIASDTQILEEQIGRVVAGHIQTETELRSLENKSQQFVERLFG